MGKEWDDDKGGRREWIAWLASVMTEALRVLKPGGHAVVWALPRTSHWTATALEDAGFEIRDCITHLFGNGFPKSHGCLKPASEHWWLVRKPGAKGVVLNVDACRVGTAKDVPSSPRVTLASSMYGGASLSHATGESSGFNPSIGRWPPNVLLSHAEGCECVGEKSVKGTAPIGRPSLSMSRPNTVLGSDTAPRNARATDHYADATGRETVADWRCVDGCPVKILGEQSGELKSGAFNGMRAGLGFNGAKGAKGYDANSGTAARFYPQFRYQAKPSRRERNAGVGGSEERAVAMHATMSEKEAADWKRRNGNHHPTVKSITLMGWLARLITPANGLILDPFTGSGTTGVAAMREGFRFVGVERQAEYVGIARARIAHESGTPCQLAIEAA